MLNDSLTPSAADLAALTPDTLLETVERQTRELLQAVGSFEQGFQRLATVREVAPRGTAHLHTRAPALPIGLFAAQSALVVAFDVPADDAPEVGDLLRVFIPDIEREPPTLRPAPNPLAQHKALATAIQDLYRSHRGRVHFHQVFQSEEHVSLCFRIQLGDGQPDRFSILGLDLRQGLERARLLPRAFPPELPRPDFFGLPELEHASWKEGQPTSALYYHTRVGPLYAFVERGALKLRDRVDIPRGPADLVLEGVAELNQSIQPYDTAVLFPATDRDDGEVLVRAEASEGRPYVYVHYTAHPRRFTPVQLSQLPGWTLPDGDGKLTSMFLWSGGTLSYLGGLPAQPFALHTAPVGPDRLYVFQDNSAGFAAETSPGSGPTGLCLHHFDSDKRRVLRSIFHVLAYTLMPDGQLFLLPRPPDGRSTPRLEHPLHCFQSPFVGGSLEGSEEELQFLRSFEPEPTRALLTHLRSLAQPIAARDHQAALSFLDQALVSFPFVERLLDIRGAIDLLHASLSRCLDVSAELSEIHARRRLSLEELQQRCAPLIRAQTPEQERATFPDEFSESLAVLSSVRTRLGELEQLSTERFLPRDVLNGLTLLRSQLDARLQQISDHSAQLARAGLAAIRDQLLGLEQALELPPTDPTGPLQGVESIQTAQRSLAESLAKLSETISGLSLLQVSAPVRLELSQAFGRAMVEGERLEAPLLRRLRASTSARIHAEFEAWHSQLTLRLATDPRACLTLQACEARRDQLLAELASQRAPLEDFPALLLELDQASTAVQQRFEARKLELLRERDAERQQLETRFQSHLQALQVAGRAATLEPTALEGFLASHPENANCIKVLEGLRARGFEAESTRLRGHLEGIKRLLVAEKRETTAFRVTGDALELGGVRLHRNTLSFDLREVLTAEGPGLALTGTGYVLEPARLLRLGASGEPLQIPQGYRGLLAETDDISRVEVLAYRVLETLTEAEDGAIDAQTLADRCQAMALAHPEEEYTLGLHDRDAALLLASLWPRWVRLGVLRWRPEIRQEVSSTLSAFGADMHAQAVFSTARKLSIRLRNSRPMDVALAQALDRREYPPLSPEAMACARFVLLHEAQREEDSREPFHWPAHPLALAAALNILDQLETTLDSRLYEDVVDYQDRLALCLPLVETLHPELRASLQHEAASLLAKVDISLVPGPPLDDIVLKVEGFAARHPQLEEGLSLDLADWHAGLRDFEQRVQPSIRAWKSTLKRMTQQVAEWVQLEELQARPLARFVWTRIMQKAYLPRVAQALEKQLGSLDRSGDDQMGLLLLVSPPGYGKTELLKKIASLLGYAFISVSGTSLGKSTTGLDPQTAPDASSRAALERLLLGLELQDNVLLDIEDVQACSEELLSRLLPLCDATRTLEIVRDGRPVRLSLQGKRAAIVMTLNPLQATIPPALANRATLLNLGDVAEKFAEEFALSYLEVAAPMNPTLEAASSRGDIELMASALLEGRSLLEIADDLVGRYARAELTRMQAVLEHFLAVRDVLMAVNRACLASASIQEAFRVDPAFELQGSYRDMVEICRAIQPDWTFEQRMAALTRHYEGQAGLLGARGEYNFLAFKRLLGELREEEETRLEHIRETFRLMQSRDKAVYLLMERLGEVSGAVQRIPDTLRESLRGSTEQLFAGIHTLQEAVQGTQLELRHQLQGVTERLQGVAEQLQEGSESLIHQLGTQIGTPVAQHLDAQRSSLEALEQAILAHTQAREASGVEAMQALEKLLTSHFEQQRRDITLATADLHEGLIQVRAAQFEAGGRLEAGVVQQLESVLERVESGIGAPLERLESGLDALKGVVEKGVARLDLRTVLRGVLESMPKEEG